MAAALAAAIVLVPGARPRASAAATRVRVVLHARGGAEPVSPRALAETARSIRGRAREMHLADVSVTTTTGARLVVTYTGDADAVAGLAKSGELRFYDFESTLRFETRDPDEAARRARTLPAVPGGTPASLYAVRRGGDHGVLGGPVAPDSASRQALIRRARGTPGGVSLVFVPRGYRFVTMTVVLPRSGAPDLRSVSYAVLLDRPALTGRDVVGAEPGVDQTGAGEPIVIVSFTREGVTAFRRLSRRLAARGARRGLNQSLAVVSDGEILTTPTIDYNQYPTGIDASNGVQVAGNFSASEADALAGRIRTRLPLVLDVRSVRRSG